MKSIDDAFSQCTNCGRLFEDDDGVINEYVTLCDDCWYEGRRKDNND